MQKLAEKLAKIPLPRKRTGKLGFIRPLPESAGVYIFFNEKVPVYVGKAINLKRRIGSYFDLNLEPKTARMISDANYVSFIRVESELESLLLEARLIRKYMPRYNVAAKDGKRPLYIAITDEKYPRVIAVRKLISADGKFIANFGPFPSSQTVRSVLKMIRRIVPFSDHKISARGCLYSHLGLCNPCPSEIEKIGNSKFKNLQKAKYIKNIKHIKSILSGKFDGVRRDFVNDMKILSKEQKYEDAANIRNKIRSLDYITQRQIPAEFYIQNPNLYEDQRKIEIQELQKLIGDWKPETGNLNRIECFDIAHLAGSSPTASMVTFINGEADKKYYRHFKIKVAKAGDDYGSLREVAQRRIKYLKTWGKPDLIIVDGGAGQVKAFTSILYSNEVAIPVVGIAKNPDRLVIGEQKINLQGSSLQIVSRMRNEAHRFARRYHHKLISKDLIPT